MTTTATRTKRVGFVPALLAVIHRDCDTNIFRGTEYHWIDDAHPEVPVEPALFFTAEFGDLSDADDILFEFKTTLRLACPVIVRTEWA